MSAPAVVRKETYDRQASLTRAALDEWDNARAQRVVDFLLGVATGLLVSAAVFAAALIWLGAL